MQATVDIRLERTESDIRTLRTAQDTMLDRFDNFDLLLRETRDIAAENRSRLLLLEEVVLENRDIIRQNRDMMRENRNMIRENRELIRKNSEEIRLNRAMLYEIRDIVMQIADHLDLTMEKPDSDPQPD